MKVINHLTIKELPLSLINFVFQNLFSVLLAHIVYSLCYIFVSITKIPKKIILFYFDQDYFTVRYVIQLKKNTLNIHTDNTNIFLRDIVYIFCSLIIVIIYLHIFLYYIPSYFTPPPPPYNNNNTIYNSTT